MTEFMFDTTFILPYCRINVKIESIQLYLEKIEDLFVNQQQKIAISTCSFLEAKWKAITLEKKENLTGLLDSANLAIDSLTKNDFFEIIPSESIASIHYLADSLLKLGHTDYMDCLIFATAKFYNLKIVSKETKMPKLIKKSELWKDLKILSWNSFLKEIKLNG